jgi:hypothetical protein
VDGLLGKIRELLAVFGKGNWMTRLMTREIENVVTASCTELEMTYQTEIRARNDKTAMELEWIYRAMERNGWLIVQWNKLMWIEG